MNYHFYCVCELEPISRERQTIPKTMLNHRYYAFLICIVLLTTSPGLSLTRTATPATGIADQIRLRIKGVDSQSSMRVKKERLSTGQLIHQFYLKRDFQPAWITSSGIQPLATEMRRAIQHSRFDGLKPADYHISSISNLIFILTDSSQAQNLTDKKVDLELLLTDSFLQIGRHLQSGKGSHKSQASSSFSNKSDDKLLTYLNGVVISGGIFSTFDELQSNSTGSEGLRRILGRYLRIQKKGGWTQIPDGKTLRKGDSDERMPLIKKRLMLTGDLASAHHAPARIQSLEFDSAVELAIFRFQGRHRIEKSGTLDQKTRHAMNIPVERRVQQIRLNMDLRRQLIRVPGNRHLFVNIPAMELRAVFAGKTALAMPVVVGKPEKPTPVFSDRVPFLVINPYWYIPPDFVEHEILPAMKHDSNYLAVRGIRLFKKMSADQQEVDPLTIDWKSLVPKEVDFYFRQDPGWYNSLGTVKFIIPNRQHIYLHDTPSKNLFKKSYRALSSGCIRVAHPLDLVSFMLDGEIKWPQTKIRHLMQTGGQRKIVLSKPIPIHVVYWTVLVDQSGKALFLPDIYDLENNLISKLNG